MSELTEENQRGLFVPERFAHGYQVLQDNTETSYQVGEFYTPGSEGGLRYDDARLGISWPLGISVMSEKDQQWPMLHEYEPELRARMELAGWSPDEAQFAGGACLHGEAVGKGS